jgi:hypothetical protein
MSQIIDGQPVNASVTNAAFIFKDVNDNALAKVGFNDQDLSLVSGDRVYNIQREQNSIWSYVGGLLNQAKTYLPTWTGIFFGTSTDNIKERIEAIDAAFSGGQHSYRAGRSNMPVGTKTVVITFSSPLPSPNYIPIPFIENLVDTKPIYLWGTIKTKTVSGFTIDFNAECDTGNYYLNYNTRMIL